MCNNVEEKISSKETFGEEKKVEALESFYTIHTLENNKVLRFQRVLHSEVFFLQFSTLSLFSLECNNGIQRVACVSDIISVFCC